MTVWRGRPRPRDRRKAPTAQLRWARTAEGGRPHVFIFDAISFRIRLHPGPAQRR